MRIYLLHFDSECETDECEKYQNFHFTSQLKAYQLFYLTIDTKLWR